MPHFLIGVAITVRLLMYIEPKSIFNNPHAAICTSVQECMHSACKHHVVLAYQIVTDLSQPENSLSQMKINEKRENGCISFTFGSYIQYCMYHIKYVHSIYMLTKIIWLNVKK